MAQAQQKITEYSYYSTIRVMKKKKLRTYGRKGRLWVNSLDLADYLDIDNEQAKSLIMLCEAYADYTLYDENDNILITSTVIWITYSEAKYILENIKNIIG